VKLTKVSPQKPYHDGLELRCVFERDGVVIEKTARLPQIIVNGGRGPGEPRYEDDPLFHWRYAISTKAKEADRDVALMQHGDAWRSHCAFELRGFWDVLPEPVYRQLTESISAADVLGSA
jgi:hypothetical protein